jgi:regulator of replication initiation timing
MMAEYVPINLVGELQQINQQLQQVTQQLNNLNQQADQQAASTQNLRIHLKNLFRTLSFEPHHIVFSPVVKEVSTSHFDNSFTHLHKHKESRAWTCTSPCSRPPSWCSCTSSLGCPSCGCQHCIRKKFTELRLLHRVT